jgi:hypothetical protein
VKSEDREQRLAGIGTGRSPASRDNATPPTTASTSIFS